MKTSIVATMVLLLSAMTVKAQNSGVQFQQAANWQEVLDKAKRENKYIFVDCYATWCAPCKYMDQNVFPDKDLGQYLNEKFIAVKIQMDRTNKDNEYVQGWHSEASQLEKKYSVTAYPTYLFFSSEGEIVHRFSAVTKTGTEFIAKVKQALDPKTQYYPNVVRYKEHLGDSAFLRNAVKVALDMRDVKMASEICNAYLSVVNPMSKENLLMIRLTTISRKDKGFDIVMKNTAKADSIMGPNFSSLTAHRVMYEEDLKPYLEPGKKIENWNRFAKKIKKRYYIVNTRSVDEFKASYLLAQKDTTGYEKAVAAFVEKYESELNDTHFNTHAWGFFMVSEKREMLEKALKWSERSLKMIGTKPDSNYPNYLDTYACLLYKLGNKEEALKWEKKSIEVVAVKNPKAVDALSKKLAKMEKGEKIWQ